jgi:hypothetical protein
LLFEDRAAPILEEAPDAALTALSAVRAIVHATLTAVACIALNITRGRLIRVLQVGLYSGFLLQGALHGIAT